MSKKKWLIIGGAGYIGCHIIREFISKGVEILVLDDLSHGYIERIPKSVKFFNLNCMETLSLNKILVENKINGVVHLAAFKQARESAREPLKYWHSNIKSLVSVLKSIENSPVKNFLFSSSCSVYGASGEVKENTGLNPISPYAKTKFSSEMIINDFALNFDISIIILRYFNVIGNGNFNLAGDTSDECLLPSILSALERKSLPKIFGNDFDTPDGTALRDYIDVRDLSYAHFLAADYLMRNKTKSLLTINVGKGKPNSVLEIIKSFQEILGWNFDYEICDKNDSDPSMVWANNDKFRRIFNWEPKINLNDSIKSFIKIKNAKI